MRQKIPQSNTSNTPVEGLSENDSKVIDLSAAFKRAGGEEDVDPIIIDDALIDRHLGKTPQESTRSIPPQGRTGSAHGFQIVSQQEIAEIMNRSHSPVSSGSPKPPKAETNTVPEPPQKRLVNAFDMPPKEARFPSDGSNGHSEILHNETIQFFHQSILRIKLIGFMCVLGFQMDKIPPPKLRFYADGRFILFDKEKQVGEFPFGDINPVYLEIQFQYKDLLDSIKGELNGDPSKASSWLAVQREVPKLIIPRQDTSSLPYLIKTVQMLMALLKEGGTNKKPIHSEKIYELEKIFTQYFPVIEVIKTIHFERVPSDPFWNALHTDLSPEIRLTEIEKKASELTALLRDALSRLSSRLDSIFQNPIAVDFQLVKTNSKEVLLDTSSHPHPSYIALHDLASTHYQSIRIGRSIDKRIIDQIYILGGVTTGFLVDFESIKAFLPEKEPKKFLDQTLNLDMFSLLPIRYQAYLMSLYVRYASAIVQRIKGGKIQSPQYTNIIGLLHEMRENRANFPFGKWLAQKIEYLNRDKPNP